MALADNRHEPQVLIGPVVSLEGRLAPLDALCFGSLCKQNGMERVVVAATAKRCAHAPGHQIKEARGCVIVVPAICDVDAV